MRRIYTPKTHTSNRLILDHGLFNGKDSYFQNIGRRHRVIRICPNTAFLRLLEIFRVFGRYDRAGHCVLVMKIRVHIEKANEMSGERRCLTR